MTKEAMDKIAEQAIIYGYMTERGDIEKGAGFIPDKLIGWGARQIGKIKGMGAAASRISQNLPGAAARASSAGSGVKGFLGESFPKFWASGLGRGTEKGIDKIVALLNSGAKNFGAPLPKNPSFMRKMRWPLTGLGAGIMIGGSMGYKNAEPPAQRYYG